MSASAPLQFKIAGTDLEFEAIHRLNYVTFVEEIPQHPHNPERRLVDKFHSENTYAICLNGDRLVGMVAGRGLRPFSLDSKLDDLDSYLPHGHKVVEVRLLAVEKNHRRGPIGCRLIGMIAAHFIDQGFDMGILSGTLRQLRFYMHMGCVPFGPIVGSGEAQFQPMYLTLDSFMRNGAAMSQSSMEALSGTRRPRGS